MLVKIISMRIPYLPNVEPKRAAFGTTAIGKKPKRSEIGAPRRCIFCDGPKPGRRMSKEHLWPDWMGAYFSKHKRRIETSREFKRSRSPDSRLKTTQWTRDGGPHTKKLRVVCEDCNNTWMSGLETEAKKYLEPIVQGRPLLLDTDAQRVISQWVALKVLTVETDNAVGEPLKAIFDQAIRDEFMVTHAVPSGFKIWLGRVDGTLSDSKWGASIERVSTWLAMFPPYHAGDPLPPTVDGTAHNIQSVTWGVGQLLIYAIATSDAKLDRELSPSVEGRLSPMWPPNGAPLYWPNTRPLPDDEIYMIANSLDEIGKSPIPVNLPHRR